MRAGRECDLVVRNGTAVAACDAVEADVAVAGGKIAAIGHGLKGKVQGLATHCRQPWKVIVGDGAWTGSPGRGRYLARIACESGRAAT